MKKNFLIYTNALLTIILGMLGFTSCDSENGSQEEYGTPIVDYHVIGNVTDQNGNPIKGIQITVKNGGEQQDKPFIYTDEKGGYATAECQDVFLRDNLRVIMEDVDGEMNGGEFKKDSILLKDMTKKQVDKSSGWYQGSFELTADKKLEKKN